MTRRPLTKSFGSRFSVHVVPVLKDNFSYIIAEHASRTLAVVDVSEVHPVMKALEALPEWPTAQSSKPNAPFAVLSTHKHWDHTGGNKDLAAKFSELQVYGGEHEAVANRTHAVKHGEQFHIGQLSVDVLHVPCHTSGHVAFHVYHPEERDNGAVFTGDTLFVGGIGAFFEGNSELMLQALDRIRGLPSGTSVFPGHDYTVNFLKFAHSVVPKDEFIAQQLKRYQDLQSQGIPTVPSTLAEERQQNVFMRALDDDFRKLMDKPSAVDLMQHLYDTCP